MVLAMLEGTPPSELVFGLAGEGDSLCTCKAVAAGKLTEPGGGVGGNTRGSPKRTVGADCPEPDGLLTTVIRLRVATDRAWAVSMGSWHLVLQTTRKRHVTRKGLYKTVRELLAFFPFSFSSLALDSCI
jgi:hypothetical protein